ncbi:MAG: hypothetical protein QXH39_03465 [Conexivisphaerales archaeon]
MAKIERVSKITMHEAKELLSKDQAELDDLQRRTLEYLNAFSKLQPEKARFFVNRLVNEASLDEDIAIQLVNIYPDTVEEIRTYLVSWKKLVTTETLEKIYNILHKA